MIIDSRLEFSVKQSVAATAVSTNVIDLTSERNIGPGRTMWVVLKVSTTIAGTTAAAALQTSDTEGSAYADIASINIKDAVAGTQFVIGVPYANKRFLRMNYTIGTGSAGAVSAWLTDQEPASWQAYPDA
ncbi:hypothetical protein H0A64_09930 [Alcaligenaceae bacterium]|nr:hypothetical protein [Alcaligenaceae bacterium]